MLIVSGPTGGSEHEGNDHPERPARINAVMAGIDRLRLQPIFMWSHPARPLWPRWLKCTDPAISVAGHFLQGGWWQPRPHTFAMTHSWSAACRAAGAGLVAVDALRQCNEGVAFVAARPPGHHALRDRAMEFCLLTTLPFRRRR